MASDPAGLVQEWLDAVQGDGLLHSRGRFTIDPESAQEMAGLVELQLCDVPLLLLAGAVEGGSRYFRVHGADNVRISWEGSAGPSGGVAHSLLVAAGVDFHCDQAGFELPPAFADFLDPLLERGRHAPLKLVWGNRLLQDGESGSRIMVTSRPGSGRLTLVDRGVDFLFPAAFPDLDIVAWVSRLPGAPWPRHLLWSLALRKELGRIGRALQESLARAV